MTLHDYFILTGIQSPFLTSQPFLPADIGIFLWVLSDEHERCPRARDKFCEKIKDIKIARAEEEIHRYLDLTFMDMDTANTSDGKQYATFVAYQIDLYAKEYGWKIKEIMDIPMRQLFQLNTAIAERYSKQRGEKYTKLRNIDMIEAQAILEQARKNKMRNN